MLNIANFPQHSCLEINSSIQTRFFDITAKGIGIVGIVLNFVVALLPRVDPQEAVMHQGRLVDRLPRLFAPGPAAHPVLSELINAILPAAPKAVEI